ncbi:hypothetical protein [Mesorhizobium retamae]|uniref:Uncharacterized protein n=1 Tax=Mesorhizobium retamae TaxID=2912854 RepID=A0ABS9QIQ6_9HYPH|nr:hypothetical protein [Mesorhizobium sp. IRAMC:0171]MCG7507225.1 hypothetical protein [Mesorhizobium sp. IRAMC:0171]
MNSFIFDGNKPRRPMTAEEQRRTKMALAANMPTDVGSGLTAIGQALMYRQNRDGSFPPAPGANPLSGLFSLGLQRKTGGLW